MNLPNISDDYVDWGQNLKRHEIFVGAMLGRVYCGERRQEGAGGLDTQVMETRKTKLGADHPDRLPSVDNLAFTWIDM